MPVRERKHASGHSGGRRKPRGAGPAAAAAAAEISRLVFAQVGDVAEPEEHHRLQEPSATAARARIPPPVPPNTRARTGRDGSAKAGRGRACDSNTRRAQGSVRRRLHRSALFKQKGESGLDPHERLDAVVDGHAEHLRWHREGDVGHCVDAIYEEVENSRQILP